jgi:hypothetical protein
MKQPTFFEGVAVALGASLVGSLLYAVLSPLGTAGWMLHLLIAGLGFGYVVYLLGRSRERAGRFTVLVLGSLAAGVTWFLTPSLALYLLAQVGVIWLVRSLYFYASLLSALADLGLSALSLAAALWAWVQTGSLFLTLWCFFLTQALFVVIPARITGKEGENHPDPKRADRFERAHRAAQAAVRKLSIIHSVVGR